MRRAIQRDTLISRFIQACRRFFADESAVASVEYAVLIALIAVVVMVGARTLGHEVKDVFEDMAEIVKELMD